MPGKIRNIAAGVRKNRGTYSGFPVFLPVGVERSAAVPRLQKRNGKEANCRIIGLSCAGSNTEGQAK